MKKLLSVLLLYLTILCAACGTEPEPDPFSVDLALYEPVLSAYHQALVERQNNPSIQSAGTYNDHALVHSIVCPYWSWEDTSTLLEKIAFTFLDLDGDGTDELLLGWHDTDSYDMQDGYVFAVYRLADDVPTFCFEGWERNRYQICSDHSVYLDGSGGADYHTYEKLLFNPTYKNCLESTELYYSYLVYSADPNTAPETHWDHAGSPEEFALVSYMDGCEELSVSEDAVRSAVSAWQSSVISLDATPFSEYAELTEIASA